MPSSSVISPEELAARLGRPDAPWLLDVRRDEKFAASPRLLAGGIEGGQDGEDRPADLARWRAVALPIIAKRPDLGVTGEAPSRWITRERPRIDHIACPWLIRRFIDPRAEFAYVPSPQVFDEARRQQAVAYDIAGAPITHEGDRCSFDALLEAFDRQPPALAGAPA